MRLLLLNGPPRSGKDTLANLVSAKFPSLIAHMKMSGYLKEMASKLFPYSFDKEEWLEKNKDKKVEALYNQTPRQVLIRLSEGFYKPLFGADFFGHMMKARINSIANFGYTGVAVSDCGFDEEIKPLWKVFGAENVRVVRLYRSHCDFQDDSRAYVYAHEHPGVEVTDYHNTTMERLDDFAAEQALWLANI